MKKSLFTLIVLSLCSLLTAQFIVWRNGQIIFELEENNVDSITFYKWQSPDNPDTPTESEYIIVKAKVPSSWDDVTAWVWATDEEGREVRATHDGDWWVITAHCEELNVIFKNGWGWNGDVNQTEEITGIRENTCYHLKQIGAQKATATAVDCPDVKYALEIEEDSIFLRLGETRKISYTLTPEYANDIFDVEFISSNEGVATVSADGLITAVSEGETKIIARVKDHEDICDTIIITITINNCELQFAQKVVYGNETEYYFDITNGDLYLENNQIAGNSGDYLRIMMFADSQENNNLPKEQKYDVISAEELTEYTICVVGGAIINNEFPFGTYGIAMTEGEVSDIFLCIDGNIKIEGDEKNATMTANFEFLSLMTEETFTREYIYNGAFDIEQYKNSAPQRVKIQK
jgi:hypothetical protein